MARRTVDEKARDYVAEGKVRVIEAAPDRAVVEVQGSGPEPYRVLLTAALPTCDCPARIWRCAHVVAAKMVTREPLRKVRPFESDARIDAILAVRS